MTRWQSQNLGVVLHFSFTVLLYSLINFFYLWFKYYFCINIEAIDDEKQFLQSSYGIVCALPMFFWSERNLKMVHLQVELGPHLHFKVGFHIQIRPTKLPSGFGTGTNETEYGADFTILRHESTWVRQEAHIIFLNDAIWTQKNYTEWFLFSNQIFQF